MYSIRTKILTIALILLAFLSGVFVFYSRVSTAQYKRLRLENIENIVSLEKERISKIVEAPEWGIEDIVGALAGIKFTENCFVLLCDPNQGHIISSTNRNIAPGDPIIRTPFDTSTFVMTHDGVDYMAFSQIMDNGWQLCINIPENEIFAAVENRNLNFSIAIAVTSLVMLFLSFIMISKLTYVPIKQLSSTVAEIAKGNLDIRAELKSKDELGLLAEAINTMALELKESIKANARDHANKERIAAELNVAAEIQTSMLPCTFPPFPGRTEFDIYATMFPAREVGGDFYDYFLVDEDNLAVVIADVSSKGVPAALFMVITKVLIKNSASSGKSPGEVFEMVNKTLCDNNDSAMFVTAFMAYYNITSGRLVYVNAGHNPPMLRKPGKDFEFLEIKPNIVMGFIEDVKYNEEEMILEPGDTFYLYTDGIIDTMNRDAEFFSDFRLREALSEYGDQSPQELLAATKTKLDLYSDGIEQTDDITMLALKVNRYGAVPPAMKKLTVEASIEKLDEVIAFIKAELKRKHCPRDLRSQIYLAVEEIFVNIANYAYAPGKGNAVIGVAAGGVVQLRFEDSGMPYNPLEQDDPHLDKPLMEREIGGLGIYLFRKIMDNVSYVREDGKNILTASKKI